MDGWSRTTHNKPVRLDKASNSSITDPGIQHAKEEVTHARREVGSDTQTRTHDRSTCSHACIAPSPIELGKKKAVADRTSSVPHQMPVRRTQHDSHPMFSSSCGRQSLRYFLFLFLLTHSFSRTSERERERESELERSRRGRCMGKKKRVGRSWPTIL